MGTRTGRAALVALVTVGLGWAVRPARGQTVIFVDASATGAGDGSSWADAYTKVQPALDAATNGQRVWVAAGRYMGTITLKLGVGLYGGFAGVEDPATFDLAERDLVGHETILQGDYRVSVVTAPSGATASTRIDGFTIAQGYSARGGGLCVAHSSPTITNNTVTRNIACFGGGLFVYDSSARIENNVITGNSTFSGGTVYGQTGGGLHVSNSSPTITGNTIAGNRALYGGGLYLWNSSGAVANTIVALNSSGICSGSVMPALRHNCVYGNTSSNYYGIADPTGTVGNIAVDPRFVRDPEPGPDGKWATSDDVVGDLHLRWISPAIDGGTNGVVEAAAVDLDGRPRILGGRVDIGAYEFGIGDFNTDRQVNGEDAARWAECMTGAGGRAVWAGVRGV